MKIATRIMMSIAGLLLIAAGVLKVIQLLTEPEDPNAYIVDTWLWGVVQTPLELGLGIWLISGLFKKAGWLIAQIGFGVFICVTIWRFATGQESCGCFGAVHVDPRITLFAMDIPVFIGLAIFYPRKEKLLPPPWPNPVHFIVVAIPTAIILSALVPTIVFNKVEKGIIEVPKITGEKPVIVFDPTKLSNNTNTNQLTTPDSEALVNEADTNKNVSNDNTAKVQPEESVKPVQPVEPIPDNPVEPVVVYQQPTEPAGDQTETQQSPEPDKVDDQSNSSSVESVSESIEQTDSTQAEPSQEPLPNEWEVLKKVDIADQIRKGLNITLLYREDCDVCHEAMPMFEEYAEVFGSDEDSVRIAFVELPPYSEDIDHSIISADTKCLLGKYIPENKKDKVFGATPIIVITQTGVPVKAWDGTDPIPTLDDLMAVMMGD